jgi:hypothetical protein
MEEITLDLLNTFKCCSSGIKWFKKQNTTDPKELFDKAIKERLMFSSINHLLARLMSKEQRITYAIYATNQAIDIYKKKYGEDKNPQKMLEGVKISTEQSNYDALYKISTDAHVSFGKDLDEKDAIQKIINVTATFIKCYNKPNFDDEVPHFVNIGTYIPCLAISYVSSYREFEDDKWGVYKNLLQYGFNLIKD